MGSISWLLAGSSGCGERAGHLGNIVALGAAPLAASAEFISKQVLGYMPAFPGGAHSALGVTRPLGASVGLLSIAWIRHGHRSFTEPPKSWATGRQVATGELAASVSPLLPDSRLLLPAPEESSQSLVAATMAIPWLGVSLS